MVQISRHTVAKTLAARPLTTAAVEQRVKQQVKELHAIVELLRELAQCHTKHALEFSQLPLQCPVPLDTSNAPAALRSVVGCLEMTVAMMAQAQTLLANDLAATVVGPLEAFEKQQHRQTKQLVAEIDDALASERQLHQSLKTAIDRATQRDTLKVKRRRTSQPEDDNQCSEDVATHGDGKTDHLRSTKEQRNRSREITKQRLEELDLTDEQQAAVVQGQLRRCFDFLSSFTTRITDHASDVVWHQQPPDTTIDTAPLADDEALQLCDLHVEATSWMATFFAQLLVVQETMVRRLQSLTKSHALETHCTVFASSTGASGSSVEDTTLWELVQSHKQLVANLADPISRTLRFSKHKQETIRKELVESMVDARKAVHVARTKVNDKEQRLVHLQQSQLLMTTTGSSENGLGVGLTALGLRTAVSAWTKQLSSPKKKLVKTKSIPLDASPLDSTVIAPPSPLRSMSENMSRLLQVEKELADARSHLAALEQTEANQRVETVRALESAAAIAVKTMELMVHDFWKNVAKAMGLMSSAIATNVEKLSGSDATSAATRGFQQLLVFDDHGVDPKTWLQLVGDDDDSNSPEKRASETETEDVDLLEDHVPDDVCFLTDPLTNEHHTTQAAPRQCKVTVDDGRRLLRRAIACMRDIITTYGAVVQQSIDRAPEQWRLVVLACVLLSFFRLAARVASLGTDWHELITLQRENSETMQQLVAFLGR